MNLSETAISLIRALQEDLPDTERPFAAVAEKVGIGEDEVIRRVAQWKTDGVIRRFGALIAHHRAGFRANGMAVWKVDEEQLAALGERFARHPSVSHCYSRPAFPGWPYRLYTMVHGTTREAVEAIARELASETGLDEYDILFSTRELKKSDTRLFREEDA